MNQIVDKMANWLVKEEIIVKADLEIYKYGIRQGVDNIINAIVLIIEAAIISVIWQSITFLFAYTLLRKYAGGMHAKTPERCFIYSQIINISVLLSVKYMLKPSLSLWFLTVVAAIIIFVFSPVETKNKKLNQEERKAYGKRAKIILVILLIFAGLLDAMIQYKQVTCILVTIFVTSLTMVCGLVKNVQ